MKKLIALFCLILVVVCTQAQDKNAIPHYKILQVDSTYTTWAKLKKKVPVVLIYFSPDCPHCQKFTTQMKRKWDDFKAVQVVMISFNKTEYPWMRMLRDFNRDYKLAQYKNLTLGTEYPDYVVQRFFQIQTTPYIAIYNKAGRLSKAFDKDPEVEDVIAAIKVASK